MKLLILKPRLLTSSINEHRGWTSDKLPMSEPKLLLMVVYEGYFHRLQTHTHTYTHKNLK